MKFTPKVSAQRRTALIIGALALIGTLSLTGRVLLKPDYSLSDALLDLGFEGLPAALLFLVIDLAIGRYEEREQDRLRLLRSLRGEETDSPTILLNQLAEGDLIAGFDLSDTSVALDIKLDSKTVSDGLLDRCELDRSSFTKCVLKRVSIRNSSFRLAVMEQCIFDTVQFDGSDLTGTLFVDCDFRSKSTFRNSNLDDVRFKRCTFAPHVVDSMDPTGARFISCPGIAAETKVASGSGDDRLESAGAEVDR
jgi:hypothetical protein